jgi:hypothetical protein
MISPSPFDQCNGCYYEGIGQANMPCLACTFGSKYKKRERLNPPSYASYITIPEKYRISYRETYKMLLDDSKYSEKRGNKEMRRRDLEIKNVIFNDPATIVYWKDGTKTVVKTQGNEPFDPEKGLAMAICKKAYGNEGSYFNQIKKWTDKYEPKEVESLYPSMMFPRVKLNFSTEEKEEFKKMLNRIYGVPGKTGEE